MLSPETIALIVIGAVALSTILGIISCLCWCKSWFEFFVFVIRMACECVLWVVSHLVRCCCKLCGRDDYDELRFLETEFDEMTV